MINRNTICKLVNFVSTSPSLPYVIDSVDELHLRSALAYCDMSLIWSFCEEFAPHLRSWNLALVISQAAQTLCPLRMLYWMWTTVSSTISVFTTSLCVPCYTAHIRMTLTQKLILYNTLFSREENFAKSEF